jgi:hypothetical protein
VSLALPAKLRREGAQMQACTVNAALECSDGTSSLFSDGLIGIFIDHYPEEGPFDFRRKAVDRSVQLFQCDPIHGYRQAACMLTSPCDL